MVFAYVFAAFETPFVLRRPYPAMLSVVASASSMSLDLADRPGAMALAFVMTVCLAALFVRAYQALSHATLGHDRTVLFLMRRSVVSNLAIVFAAGVTAARARARAAGAARAGQCRDATGSGRRSCLARLAARVGIRASGGGGIGEALVRSLVIALVVAIVVGGGRAAGGARDRAPSVRRQATSLLFALLFPVMAPPLAAAMEPAHDLSPGGPRRFAARRRARPPDSGGAMRDADARRCVRGFRYRAGKRRRAALGAGPWVECGRV